MGSRAPRDFQDFSIKIKHFRPKFLLYNDTLTIEQADDEVELFRLDHDKLHNPFQSFISVAASLQKWNRQLADNCFF